MYFFQIRPLGQALISLAFMAYTLINLAQLSAAGALNAASLKTLFWQAAIALLIAEIVFHASLAIAFWKQVNAGEDERDHDIEQKAIVNSNYAHGGLLAIIFLAALGHDRVPADFYFTELATHYNIAILAAMGYLLIDAIKHGAQAIAYIRGS
ncbi:hypothetical protein IMCC3088_2230 [Aequoribacter fuscus]|uniref:Uncharacterized protein n=1 Tax=Aequoribacter fuscus TaxID=2518989 RepID=F3L3N8_9GAMM|nr:hypothetical protein [Aequoribacter fuscus]EGG29068.1 hypothetical protein IMCC3088_2230 [Aequoribacter fuscus]QHJ87915.1 hypothetical protein EYZ66_06200 [Aequoribacter fuscus]